MKPIYLDFGTTFSWMRGQEIPAPRRIKGNKSFEKNFKVITRLANLSGKPYEDDDKRFKYQENLSKICLPMVNQNTKGKLALIIERGAVLIASFFNFPKNQLILVRAKRIKSNNSLGLELSNFRIPKDCKKYNQLVILEDCIATGDTIFGCILSLQKMGIDFEKIEINCPLSSQFGYEYLKKSFKKLTINFGTIAYGLDENFYIRRTAEEGYPNKDFYVGDMGEWSKKLPAKFDKIAWWNKNRLDY